VAVEGEGTGGSVGGEPITERLDPARDKRAVALLALEPRQGRVRRAALTAADRGLHLGAYHALNRKTPRGLRSFFLFYLSAIPAARGDRIEGGGGRRRRPGLHKEEDADGNGRPSPLTASTSTND
jgi:hypothetical protein